MNSTIQYIGEDLLPRTIGHFTVILGFVAALFSAIAYFFATQNRENATLFSSWRKLGRWGFGVHAVSVFTTIGMVFYVMIAKKFEYHYAWSHTDTELPFRYVFAAFWEGQEGSFMLWQFWHVILGLFLMWRAKEWETSTLAVLAAVQVILCSMVLGIYIGFGENAIRWGINPIQLFRDVQDLPLFRQPDYVTKIAATAKGLNPLLQNYWMTIHPPTLFLGFASTTIPFCFAIAGFWTKRYTEWLRPVLPYTLFSGAILGLGILMGAAWAYEALSFGGYWAWDPVENMSLVPWLILVAGLHTNLIANATNQSIRSTFLFYVASFLLVLYSTFLTRSGVLGDTSVHAFTELGLESQLIIFQLVFLFLAVFIYIKHTRQIPTPEKEEATSSKEFWMFIGTLVLLMSVILISFTTSIPVYNKIFDALGLKIQHLTSPVEPVPHYNKYQLWIGVFIGLLSAATQFLRFKEFNFKGYFKKFVTHLGISVALTLVLTILGTMWIQANAWQYQLLLFSGIFTVVANLDYFIFFAKGNPRQTASVLSHIGFGLMIVGIMASGLNKRWISNNRFAMEGLAQFNEEQLNKNILLIKDAPMVMNGYDVKYTKDTIVGHTRTFTLAFKHQASGDSFALQPYILWNKEFSKIASTNPQTKHYWNKDIFTHIASLPPAEMDMEAAKAEEDSLKYVDYELIKGVEQKAEKFTMTIEEITPLPKIPNYTPQEGDISVGLKLALKSNKNDSIIRVEPFAVMVNGRLFAPPINADALGLRLRIKEDIFDRLMFAAKNDSKMAPPIGIAIAEGASRRDFIVLEAIVFEGINYFWAGSLLMLIGMAWAMWIRRKI